MTDRELLELAAKAAGLRYSWYAHGVGPMIIVSDLPDNSGGMPQRTRWNPLDDDGDALRLAVKLKIEIVISDQSATAIVDMIGCSEPLGADHDAATRRAIVRAAAEIGRQMT